MIGGHGRERGNVQRLGTALLEAVIGDFDEGLDLEQAEEKGLVEVQLGPTRWQRDAGNPGVDDDVVDLGGQDEDHFLSDWNVTSGGSSSTMGLGVHCCLGTTGHSTP